MSLLNLAEPVATLREGLFHISLGLPAQLAANVLSGETIMPSRETASKISEGLCRKDMVRRVTSAERRNIPIACLLNLSSGA